MADEGFKRKLAAILSADVEGYSRLMDDDEEATVRTLTAYRSAITDLVQQFRGRVVDTPGDNILTEFTSVVDAVNCAVEIQRELAERNAELPYNRQMQFRIGVNLGDVIEEDGRIYGDGVNIAARVESVAEAGGICISGRAHDQVENKLGLEYEDLGKHQVKNIARPIQVYRVLSLPGAAAHRVVQAKKTLGRRWRKIAISAAVVVVIVGVLGVWNFYMRRPSIEPASVDKMAFPLPEKPSIAVLPFDNMSGDPEQDYIADGFTENIITGLSQIPEMFVIARNSTFTYKGKPVKVKQVSEELGVKYVLEGSIQKVGDRLRVNAQLIDALEGHHLWAERYDRDLKDLFNLQDEMTMKIVAALEVKLTRRETIGNKYKTDSFEAWSHLPKGFSLLNRGTVGDLLKARNHFEQAVNLDPDYAYAWTLLAWTYTIEAMLGRSESRGESIKRSFDLAQKAAGLGENQAGIHSLMCRIYRLQGKYDEAIAEGKKSVALAPNSSRAHIFLAESLHYGGRPEEAIVHAKKAMRLEPYYPAWFLGHLAGPYEMVGRYEEANAIWKKFLERALKGEFPPIKLHERLVINYVRLDRMEEAQAHAAEILKIKPDYTVAFYRNRKTRAYKDKVYLENQVDLLRKAGLPEHPPLPLPDKPSIAVLAFDNMSGDPEQEYFGDGISEDLITDLSKIPDLLVISRLSSFTYKGKSVKIEQIAEELGVRYVLEGSVRKADNTVRINAQLIDAATGHHLWAERYDGDMSDIFTLQDKITRKITASLAVKLTEDEQDRLAQKDTNNIEAYEAYLKGSDIANSLRNDPEKFAESLPWFEKAIELDPGYSLAYAALAETYIFGSGFGIQNKLGISYRIAFMRGTNYLQMAMKNPTNIAYRIAARVYSYQRQHEKALDYGMKAIALGPNEYRSNAFMATGLIFAGRPDEAVAFADKMRRADPACLW